MTPEQFAYWLQGFVELNPSMEQPTPEQWKAIGEHLQTVFKKVTPAVQAPRAPNVASPALPTYPPFPMSPRLSDISWPGGIAPVVTC